ncbi:hypothetical protein ACJ5H2_13320 [Nocardioides sp. R1-1]|uniref:hypothetical protein n=1 Tax=Nocardioides sp. R1-1 TaxID=3383502 RepID=UPI0038D0DB06
MSILTAPRAAAALLLSLMLTSGAVVLAGPAQADRWTYEDAAGDVSHVVETDTSLTVETLPDQANGDVVRVDATHTRRKITLRLQMRTRLSGMFMLSGTIRTPASRFMFMSSRVPGMGGTELLDLGTEKDDPTVRCAGLKRTFSSDRTALRIAIPRTCLGSPRWFRFRASLTTMAVFTDDSYDDDALRAGSGLFSFPASSPKIRR